MNRQWLIGVLLSASVGASMGHAQQAAHWTYSGDTGPKHWGQLSEDFASCTVGKNQSPIDIDTDNIIAAKLDPLVLDYRGKITEIINTGHTLQANVVGSNTLLVEGMKFELLQFHLHSPSEHKIDGEPFPLELHLVHQNDQGELAVVGMLFREGEAHENLVSMGDKAPRKAGDAAAWEVDLTEFLSGSRFEVPSYYRYSGSLTTPPCSEGLRWYVYPVIKTVSREQIARYIGLIGYDARGSQPVNARLVLRAGE